MLMDFDEGILRLKAAIEPYLRVEKVALTECLGRILASDIIAQNDYPAFLTASMDGFAINFSDAFEGIDANFTENSKPQSQNLSENSTNFKAQKNENLNSTNSKLNLAQTQKKYSSNLSENSTQKNSQKPLKILGQVPAGTEPKFRLNKNECVKTFTGSLLCENADTLVPVENVQVVGDLCFINEAVPKGFAVRKVGESYKKGDVLLKKGARLEFAELALLAELGYFHISVFAKPVFGILSSGNELLDLGENPTNIAQIRSSNHIALANLAKFFGARAVIFPILKDEQSAVKSAIANALEGCDVLITTGGVSMGDFDYLKDAVREYEIIIDKLNIKPGRHIKIAKCGKKFILAFPGFPYSSMVAFHLFARTILNSWFAQDENYKIQAFLEHDFNKKTPYFEFIACNLKFYGGKIFVNLDGKKQGSSAIVNNLNSNSALMLAPPDKKTLRKGDLVDILLLR